MINLFLPLFFYLCLRSHSHVQGSSGSINLRSLNETTSLLYCDLIQLCNKGFTQTHRCLCILIYAVPIHRPVWIKSQDHLRYQGGASAAFRAASSMQSCSTMTPSRSAASGAVKVNRAGVLRGVLVQGGRRFE